MADGDRRFGALLKELRETRRLSLEDVERVTGTRPGSTCVSRSLLSRAERGQASIAAEKLVVLARLYRVRPGFLVDRLELELDLTQAPEDDRAAGEAGPRAPTGPPEARSRVRLGLARSLAARARPHAARALLDDLLGERLGHEDRAWTLFLLAQTSLQLGHALLARGAYLGLLEVPRPWPREIASAAPGLDGIHH